MSGFCDSGYASAQNDKGRVAAVRGQPRVWPAWMPADLARGVRTSAPGGERGCSSARMSASLAHGASVTAPGGVPRGISGPMAANGDYRGVFGHEMQPVLRREGWQGPSIVIVVQRTPQGHLRARWTLVPRARSASIQAEKTPARLTLRAHPTARARPAPGRAFATPASGISPRSPAPRRPARSRRTQDASVR